MKNNSDLLNLTESSDFQYLLELMLLLYEEPAYAWLPELFSIIGYEKLLLLAKFCGGETIKIPKLDELREAIEVLDWYYKIYIIHKKRWKTVPEELVPKIKHLAEVIDAQQRKK